MDNVNATNIKSFLKLFEESSRWTQKQILEYQLLKLKELLTMRTKTLPFITNDSAKLDLTLISLRILKNSVLFLF